MDDEELKAVILTYRRAGAPMKEVVGPGKLVSTWTFAKLKADPNFLSALEAADESLGKVSRRFVFDAVLTQRIIDAIKAGWTTEQKAPSPDLPGWTTIWKRKHVDDGFAAAIEQALSAARRPNKHPRDARLCLSMEEKAEVLKRVAAGRMMNGLGEGAPSKTRIHVHRQADPGFDGEVKRLLAAQRTAASQECSLTPDMAGRIMDALRAGHPLNNLGEGLPSWSTVLRWRQQDVSFAEVVRSALVSRAAAATAAMQESEDRPALEFESLKSRQDRRRVTATKEAILEALEDGEMVSRAIAGVASQSVLKNYLRADPEFQRRYREALAHRRTAGNRLTRFGWTQERREAVLSAIRGGAKLSRLGENMPTAIMVNRQRRQDPEMNAAVRGAMLERRKQQQASRKTKLKRPPPMPITFRLNQTNDVYAAANRAVSRSLPPFARDDIISEIVLSVLAGETAPHEIPAKARAFSNAYHRMTESRSTVSMDNRGNFGGDANFHDLIAIC
ncbi:hypothetical protein ACP4J4_01700 [Aureimonas ureilytica]|uniref:hypothetical protein n=1 Tax=Aureimonas ureilytica TaxID=401562 RepID=UPI003CEAE371